MIPASGILGFYDFFFFFCSQLLSQVHSIIYGEVLFSFDWDGKFNSPCVYVIKSLTFVPLKKRMRGGPFSNFSGEIDCVPIVEDCALCSKIVLHSKKSAFFDLLRLTHLYINVQRLCRTLYLPPEKEIKYWWLQIFFLRIFLFGIVLIFMTKTNL